MIFEGKELNNSKRRRALKRARTPLPSVRGIAFHVKNNKCICGRVISHNKKRCSIHAW